MAMANDHSTNKHPRCNKCQGLLLFEKAYGQVPDRVVCLLCGWDKAREISSKFDVQGSRLTTTNVESRPHAGRLGTCPVCFRENLYIRGPKCSRCYKRIRSGRDVHAA